MKVNFAWTATLLLLLANAEFAGATQTRSVLQPTSKLVTHRNEGKGTCHLNSQRQIGEDIRGGSGGDGHEGELMGPVTAFTNILADLCPHGMLPLAFGIAAGGGTGALTATMTLLIFGALSWYSLLSWGRAADVVLKGSHEESLSAVWGKVIPNGDATSYVPDALCALLTIGCLLFYSAFIGDLFGALASGLPLPNAIKN